MLHISEFRVSKYADKGAFPLSPIFYVVYALLFEWLSLITCVNKSQDNE